MAVYGYGSKEKNSSNCLPFPATKGTLGGAVGTTAITLTSGALTGFGAAGPVRVHITADNSSKIATWGDSIQVDVYVANSDTVPVNTAAGFRADTYWRVGSYYDLEYSVGAAAISTQYVFPWPADKVKVYAYLGAGDSLLTGHGCQVDVSFQDLFSGAKRASYIERPYTTMYGATTGVSLAFGDSTTLNDYYTPAINCGFTPSKIWTFLYVQDISKYMTAVAGHGRFAGRFSVAVETSSDGSHWIHGDSGPTYMRPNGGTGTFLQGHLFEQFDNQVSVYPTAIGLIGKFNTWIRLKYYGDTFCRMLAGHGTRMGFVCYE